MLYFEIFYFDSVTEKNLVFNPFIPKTYNSTLKVTCELQIRVRHILTGGSGFLDSDPPKNKFKFKISKREIYQRRF